MYRPISKSRARVLERCFPGWVLGTPWGARFGFSYTADSNQLYQTLIYFNQRCSVRAKKTKRAPFGVPRTQFWKRCSRTKTNQQVSDLKQCSDVRMNVTFLFTIPVNTALTNTVVKVLYSTNSLRSNSSHKLHKLAFGDRGQVNKTKACIVVSHFTG